MSPDKKTETSAEEEEGYRRLVMQALGGYAGLVGHQLGVRPGDVAAAVYGGPVGAIANSLPPGTITGAERPVPAPTDLTGGATGESIAAPKKAPATPGLDPALAAALSYNIDPAKYIATHPETWEEFNKKPAPLQGGGMGGPAPAADPWKQVINPKAVAAYDQAQGMKLGAIDQRAAAEKQAAADQVSGLDKASAGLAADRQGLTDMQARQAAEAQKVEAEYLRAVKSLEASKPNYNRVFDNGKGVLAAIAVGLGELGSARLGRPNAAMAIVNGAISRDIQEQQDAYERKKAGAEGYKNVYGMLRQRGLDEQQAYNTSMSIGLKQAGLMMDKIAAQSKGQISDVNAADAKAQAKAAEAQFLAQAYQRADLTAGKGGGGGGGAKQDLQTLEFLYRQQHDAEKDKFERDKENYNRDKDFKEEVRRYGEAREHSKLPGLKAISESPDMQAFLDGKISTGMLGDVLPVLVGEKGSQSILTRVSPEAARARAVVESFKTAWRHPTTGSSFTSSEKAPLDVQLDTAQSDDATRHAIRSIIGTTDEKLKSVGSGYTEAAREQWNRNLAQQRAPELPKGPQSKIPSFKAVK
jgi:hypothetical protein